MQKIKGFFSWMFRIMDDGDQTAFMKTISFLFIISAFLTFGPPLLILIAFIMVKAKFLIIPAIFLISFLILVLQYIKISTNPKKETK